MTDVEKLLTLNYKECFDFLITKYGAVPGDYYLDPQCTKKNVKITRGKEGLYIHHFDEDKAIMLSTPGFATKNPFEYQKAERLVYCNLLEHLVLHIKIVEYPSPDKNWNNDVGIGGVCNFIVPELNDIYSGIEYKQPWKQMVCKVVLPLKDDYFKCLAKLVAMDFPQPLLTTFTFNTTGGLWSIDKNEPLFKEMRKLGVKR